MSAFESAVAAHAFHTSAISDVTFTPHNINSPHNTLNMTRWLKNPYRITVAHYFSFMG